MRYALTSASSACHTPKLAVSEGIMPVMSLIEKALRLPLPEMVRIVSQTVPHRCFLYAEAQDNEGVWRSDMMNVNATDND